MVSNNWIRKAQSKRDCIEAFFHGAAFSPHRHDTYTFALTTYGVQNFNYRGALRHSTPGSIVILHPDEVHDGQAGTTDGFGYQSICIMPSEIQRVVDGRPLPFIEGGVSTSPRLLSILKVLLSELDRQLDDIEYEETILDLAFELEVLAGSDPEVHISDYLSAEKARQFIDENIAQGFTLYDLENVIGKNRWQLCRDFRALFGTSPYRYLVMRRLERAQHMILEGASLSDAAFDCSFSDQSHLNRHFKKTYGMSPKVWFNSIRSVAS